MSIANFIEWISEGWWVEALSFLVIFGGLGIIANIVMFGCGKVYNKIKAWRVKRWAM